MRFFILIALQLSFAFGHGELDEQIREISKKIATEPGNPELLLVRAALHQSHRDPKAALEDLLSATRINPPHPPAFLALTKFQRSHGATAEAKEALNRYFQFLSGASPNPKAHRELALLSSGEEALQAWRLFLKNTATTALSDHVLAARAALKANDLETTHKFVTAGLERHPKSIELHQIHACILLAKGEMESAETLFRSLRLLYPNLLVSLYCEESRIWNSHHQPDRSREALRAGLEAFEKLPTHLRKNPDLQALAAQIKIALQQ